MLNSHRIEDRDRVQKTVSHAPEYMDYSLQKYLIDPQRKIKEMIHTVYHGFNLRASFAAGAPKPSSFGLVFSYVLLVFKISIFPISGFHISLLQPSRIQFFHVIRANNQILHEQS